MPTAGFLREQTVAEHLRIAADLGWAPMTATEIAQSTQLTVSQVYVALRSLARQGRAEQIGVSGNGGRTWRRKAT